MASLLPATLVLLVDADPGAVRYPTPGAAPTPGRLHCLECRGGPKRLISVCLACPDSIFHHRLLGLPRAFCCRPRLSVCIAFRLRSAGLTVRSGGVRVLRRPRALLSLGGLSVCLCRVLCACKHGCAAWLSVAFGSPTAFSGLSLAYRIFSLILL